MTKVIKVIKKSNVRFILAEALRDSKDKSVLVVVKSFIRHAMYQKQFAQTHKYLVHTEMEVKKGQLVKICQIKPMSKRKTWKVIEVK